MWSQGKLLRQGCSCFISNSWWRSLSHPTPHCYACQPRLLETTWQRVRQQQGTPQLLHAEKGAVCWRKCRQPWGGGGDEETLPYCSPNCSGNIWAIRHTYWVTRTTCRAEKTTVSFLLISPRCFEREGNVGGTCLTFILTVTLNASMIKGRVFGH